MNGWKLPAINRMLYALVVIIYTCFAPAFPIASAADWPTYRCDSRRSGYTAEMLPAKPSLQWTYKARHAPHPAWSGRDTRMPFDCAYHTVIADGTLFFGSSADCKVYALDAATGGERWTFFTDSPVRFAPAVWKGRVFVVSDDGFLYCLTAKEGKLLWKLRGGPVDSMLLGNGRMVSRWPARGGPVVLDGIVYFAAGIWPSEGIFLYAVDAATGKVLWCNDTAGSMYMPQPHPTANAKSGVSVQGYLVSVGNRLLVPTGRAVPASFDRATGQFQYFHLQRYRGLGGSAIVATDSNFFNSGFIFDSKSGHSFCKCAEPSIVVITPEYIVYSTGDKIAAIDRANMWTQEETFDRKGKSIIKTVLNSPLWQMKNPHKADSLIVAGNAVIVGTAGRISMLDMSSQETLFTTDVDGVPYGLAVADSRLFVSTDKGIIYCFGGDITGQPKVIEPEPADSPYPANDAFVAAAEEIIRRTGVAEGYCLDLACGDGALAYALAKCTKLHIYAVDKDPEKVALARRRLDSAGLYGVRVTVLQGDPAATAYPNYFANLVVSGRSVTEGTEVVPVGEMNRLLRPYGGIACTGRANATKKTIRNGLDNTGIWTHQYCDPANTNCSTDMLAKGPLGMLWFTDFGFQMPSRHGRGPAPLFLDGRLFVEGVNGLCCIDAYNGRMLWEYPLPGILKAYDQEHLNGAAITGSNFCIDQGRLYVRIENRCLCLDAVTGRKIAEFKAPLCPDGQVRNWGYIACENETLYGSVSNEEHIIKWAFLKSNMSKIFSESVLFFAMDARTGKLKWSYKPEYSIRNNTIAIGGGCVYLIDQPLAMGDLLVGQAAKRRGESVPTPQPSTGTLLALNAADGGVVWKCREGIYGTMLALSKEYDVLLMVYQNTRFKLPSELGGRMTAFRASNGERLWDIKADYASRPILNGRTIYAQPGAWDILTGEQKDFKFSRSYGCGILAGSKNLLVFRSATLGYSDLLHYQGTENYGGIRPGCWINTLPVGGLVLMPDATDRCTCSYLIKSSVALQPYGIRPPVVSPDGGTFSKSVTITLAADTKGVEIHYTLNGSTPTLSSKRYAGPVRVSKSMTLKVRAFIDGLPPSQVNEASFIINSNTPE